MMSVVALRLINLREEVKANPEGPAEEAGLEPLELEVLRTRTGRKIETTREVALALGRMGGHLNRKGDGTPGWQTLWRGMEKLSLLYERHTKIWIERHDSVGADLCVCPGLAIAPLRCRHTGLPLRYPVLGVPGI